MKVKQASGALLVVAAAILAAIGGFAPSKLGSADLGFTLFLINQLWPELILILLVGIWLYASENEVSKVWRGFRAIVMELAGHAQTRSARERAMYFGAFGTLVLLLAACAWGLYKYANYRSQYLLKGYAHTAFKFEKLTEASSHEARFEFLKAAEIYKELRSQFKSDMNSSHWLERETFDRQIASYATSATRHAKNLEGRLGLARATLLAYAEVLRVNPSDAVSLERLASLMAMLNSYQPAIKSAVADCFKDPSGVEGASWRTAEPLLFESEIVDAAKRRLGSKYSRSLCQSLVTIGSEEEALRFVMNSWQATRIETLLKQANEGTVAIIAPPTAPRTADEIRQARQLRGRREY